MPHSSDDKPNIYELDQNQLNDWCDSLGIQPYRAGQIMRWIYSRGADGFDQMTDISKNIRNLLAERFVILPLEKKRIENARDGSRKYLFGLADGNSVETVLIPEKNHYTLCISTQVGCAMGCRFCMTAKSGLIRNLTKGEIIGQVLGVLKDITGNKRLTNIVLMGMGEPLANYGPVVSAINLITDSDIGLGFSHRRVTLSTSGVISKFTDLARDTRVKLAVSLNAADNPTRNLLMPINKTYPLEQLIDACAQYPLAPREKITFEYILIKDVNDSPSDALKLSKILHPVKAKINLIPFNPHPGSEFAPPEESVILKFQDVLCQKNYTAIIRRSKGSDISAACGQLSAKAS
jgi:23S rRNA (adenine2503-C2)-methyltransferase